MQSSQEDVRSKCRGLEGAGKYVRTCTRQEREKKDLSLVGKRKKKCLKDTDCLIQSMRVKVVVVVSLLAAQRARTAPEQQQQVKALHWPDRQTQIKEQSWREREGEEEKADPKR